jgi:hypothetical protein
MNRPSSPWLLAGLVLGSLTVAGISLAQALQLARVPGP